MLPSVFSHSALLSNLWSYMPEPNLIRGRNSQVSLCRIVYGVFRLLI